MASAAFRTGASSTDDRFQRLYAPLTTNLIDYGLGNFLTITLVLASTCRFFPRLLKAEGNKSRKNKKSFN